MPEPLPSWQDTDVLRLDRFARIRLVVADVDGTLVTAPGAELSRMVQALNRKLGLTSQVLFTIATGRAYAGIATFVEHISLRADVPIAVYNGSLVIRSRSKTVLLSDVVPSSALELVINACIDHPVTVLAYSRVFPPDWGGIFDPSQEHLTGWAGERPDYEKDINGLPIEWRASKDRSALRDACAILIDLSGADIDLSELLFALSRIPDISVTKSGIRFLEIRPAIANKGRALRVMTDALAINLDETLAIGDNDNDVEMLRSAGIGVTVATASPAALENSAFICKHGVGAGAVETLRVIRQAKRYHNYFQSQMTTSVRKES